MTIEKLELAILRILNDAPQQSFTSDHIHSDVNHSQPVAVSRSAVWQALEFLAARNQIAQATVEGVIRTSIASAGIFRVLKAPGE